MELTRSSVHKLFQLLELIVWDDSERVGTTGSPNHVNVDVAVQNVQNMELLDNNW